MQKGQCYLCLEDCDTRSPCQCRSFLHMQCQHRILSRGEFYYCTVCHQPFHNVDVRTRRRLRAKFVALFLFFLSFSAFGVAFLWVLLFKGRTKHVVDSVVFTILWSAMTFCAVCFGSVLFLAFAFRRLFYTTSVVAVMRVPPV